MNEVALLSTPLESDDPFGPDIRPTRSIEQILADRRGEGTGSLEEAYDRFTAPVKAKGPKLVKDSAQYARAIRKASELYPGVSIWARTEWVSTQGGMMVKRDLWGFADVLGYAPMALFDAQGAPVTACRNVAVQITSIGQVQAHIRKYVSDAKSADEMPTEEKLRRFLRAGNVALIFGYHKPGRTWECEVTEITEAVLDAAKGRKRR